MRSLSVCLRKRLKRRLARMVALGGGADRPLFAASNSISPSPAAERSTNWFSDCLIHRHRDDDCSSDGQRRLESLFLRCTGSRSRDGTALKPPFSPPQYARLCPDKRTRDALMKLDQWRDVQRAINKSNIAMIGLGTLENSVFIEQGHAHQIDDSRIDAASGSGWRGMWTIHRQEWHRVQNRLARQSRQHYPGPTQTHSECLGRGLGQRSNRGDLAAIFKASRLMDY